MTAQQRRTLTRARRARRTRIAGDARTAHGRGGTRWVASVKTVSTVPPPGIFAGSAEHIARTMASRRVSPKGIGSGIRMIQYFINRAGRNLPASRRRALERAKRMLQAWAAEQKAAKPKPSYTSEA